MHLSTFITLYHFCHRDGTDILVFTQTLIYVITVVYRNTNKDTSALSVHCMEKYISIVTIRSTVSVLGQDKGYTTKYTPSPEGVPKGKV